MKLLNGVSVIIPSYNKSKFLSNCIESVLKQTYKNIEILIVDDCSNDGSQRIIRRYSDMYSNIKYLFHETNEGVSKSRNDGARVASNNYITFLDADDYYYSVDKISREMIILNEDNYETRKDIIPFSSIQFVNEEGTKITCRKLFKKLNGAVYKTVLLSGAFSRFIIRDYILERRKFFEIGGYQQNLSLFEDYDFLIRLCENSCFVHSGCIGTAYRQISGGLSDKKKEHLLQTKKDICSQYLRNSYSLVSCFSSIYFYYRIKTLKKAGIK
jgi:glycosyltransferase involved in cell wall biosynthesis